MVEITLTSGPLKGDRLQSEEIDPSVGPGGYLRNLVEMRFRWHLDFTRADDDERLAWERADLLARVLMALVEGRGILFEGRSWIPGYYSGSPETTAEIERWIDECAQTVIVVTDDPTRYLELGFAGDGPDTA